MSGCKLKVDIVPDSQLGRRSLEARNLHIILCFAIMCQIVGVGVAASSAAIAAFSSAILCNPTGNPQSISKICLFLA